MIKYVLHLMWVLRTQLGFYLFHSNLRSCAVPSPVPHCSQEHRPWDQTALVGIPVVTHLVGLRNFSVLICEEETNTDLTGGRRALSSVRGTRDVCCKWLLFYGGCSCYIGPQ